MADNANTSPRDGFLRRNDPALAGAFAKDATQEAFLDRLNEILGPHEEADYIDLEEEYPTLHIVGAPRSGTTLLYQTVVSGLEIGYVNNLVAAFWRAPVYGLRLSQKLGLDPSGSSFDSSFGRTQGLLEPHEFGYFWNGHLRYPDLTERPYGHEDTIDWGSLRRVLVNMAHWNGGPMAFKPMLLVWHMEAMLRHMPRSCFVWIRRDPVQAAVSLLAMRRSLFGSMEQWASLRPKEAVELAEEPPWRQVAAQVVLLERVIEDAAERMGPEHVLRIRHEDFCAEPRERLEEIRGLLGSKGFEPALKDVEIGPFEVRRSSLDEEYGERVAAAIEEYAEALS